MKNRTILYSLITVVWACASVAAQSAKTNKPAVAPYPHIVREVQLTGQAGPIPTTTLFIPKSNGLFRLSGVMVMTAPADQCQDGCTWGGTIGFSPDTGATTNPWIGIEAGVVGGGVSSNTLTVRNNAGQPLTYSVSCTQGDCSGSVYELFITVEQIQ
jgi:hypothetical protein